MTSARVEYVGFNVTGTAREYLLLVRRAGDSHEFTLVIPNEAFLSRRVRYQDAPEVCYLKLQRELAACADDGLPAACQSVTDAELEEYRLAHAPKPSQRRPRAQPAQALEK